MKHAIEVMLEERDKDISLKSELKGELKTMHRIARAMLARGDDANSVVEVTGLTIDDILRLQSE
jgi:hypothetical protein